MKHIWLIFCLVILISSCSTIGTKTIYKSNSYKSLSGKSLGVLEIKCDSVLLKFYANTNNVFENVIDSVLKSHYNFQIQYIPFSFCSTLPTADEIKNICHINKLDALLIPEIKFTDRIPFKYFDTSMYLYLYDNNANCIIATWHNTNVGNSYFKTPTTEITIKDATLGSLGRIITELNVE